MQPSGVCRLSVYSYPQPQSIPVLPRRRPPDCTRCCCHYRRRCSSRSPGGSESAREGGREAAGLPSALLVPSSPSSQVPSPTLCSRAHCPRPSHASSPSRPAQGSLACQAPRYPGNLRGDHSRQLPTPTHAHLLGVPPSQALGPSHQRSPGVLAEAGGWVKRRGVCEEKGPGR